jgi:hypothetical protein
LIDRRFLASLLAPIGRKIDGIHFQLDGRMRRISAYAKPAPASGADAWWWCSSERSLSSFEMTGSLFLFVISSECEKSFSGRLLSAGVQTAPRPDAFHAELIEILLITWPLSTDRLCRRSSLRMFPAARLLIIVGTNTALILMF